ncbi:hypothetical protein CC78DRAFT_529430 [Lojkania enalia]|uniref:Chromosome condensation protein n=1 Tax=Lojkania enalia TaxID=147567 RepID=A0A9P4TNQ4_9PLEO|nr:hypothetical protein CC78DRAFT_529430 [Didymosphaeria enalia]
MADSDDGSQSQRESHYNQQRSSLRSDRSLHTSSRPGSSQLLQSFSVSEDNVHSNTPSPSPVIPMRRQSLEDAKRKGSRNGRRSRRGSMRSDTRSRDGRTGSRGRELDDYSIPDAYGNLNEILGPAPVQNPREQDIYRHSTLEEERSQEQSRRSSRRRSSASRARELDDYNIPDAYRNLGEIAGPAPVENPHERDLYRHSTLEEERSQERSRRGSRRRSSRHTTPLSRGATPADFTALPQFPEEQEEEPGRRKVSRVMTELYTVSYLIIFSILGTLARIGLQWLTFYPGAPVVFSELWANFAGTLFMGFLAEDSRLFREEWGKGVESASNSSPSEGNDEEKAIHLSAEAKASHTKVKKTIPLYIGLATGFCGSFTSFSSFIRDAFLALSNNLPSPINHAYPQPTAISPSSTVSRNGGYSFMAVCAVLILTLTLCYSALTVGAHIAIYIARFTPTLSFYITRRIVDPLMVFVAWGAWLGAVFMAIWPPDRPGGPSSKGSWVNETWRGQTIFACVFAPVGCLLRFYVSLKLNGLIASFPLGTFCVNIFGTAALGMAFDLQHVRIGPLAGGGRLGCQVLQGIMDGFCGALTTVSTWIAEINGLRRSHAYIYALMSVGVGLGVLVAVMGSVRWAVGWTAVACVTGRTS